MVNKDLSVYAAMQTGSPVSTYRKTIQAKVHVTIMNPFSGEPQGVILQGDPGSKSKAPVKEAVITFYSIEGDMFFRNMNLRHFEDGTIIAYTPPVTEPVKAVEQSTDEEIAELLGKPFLTLQSVLDKTNSTVFVQRILQVAKDEEKSMKYIKKIEARLAEIQNSAVTQDA
jgi:hypothetical protein